MMLKWITKLSPVESGHEDDLSRQWVKRELLGKMRPLLDEG